MRAEQDALFRKTALARLASPERLDARLELPAYPRTLLATVAALAILAALFAAWLLTNR